MIARQALFALLVLAPTALAQQPDHLRIATYNADLSRRGPGLLLRDILSGADPQIAAVVSTLANLNADILVLTDVDFDHDRVALSALADQLAKAGAPYPHRFAKRPNTGMATGLDLDGDTRLSGPRDAQGFGYFSGQGGIAVLSRLPFDTAAFRDFSDFLWQDLPDNVIGDSLDDSEKAVLRLSTTAHWDLPVMLPDEGRLHLLIWHATPPVFDGPKDRNGRRNHDETAFWLALLDGTLPMAAPDGPFVILGDANLDPVDGDGRNAAIRALLADPRLQDPAPKGSHNRAEPDQNGDPALDTALYDFGGLRVDFVLPSSDLRVAGSGVDWPKDAAPNAATLARASRHRPVWVDIALP
ncbi:endonuclease/exonuclease/phosphatase family protein [Pseudorhodobacter ferrugineus]|uniref:endonuclease/exonuclease/phosphatase family protein n=1 Tax=Pseudorhodobacter ferrugineus TaxID=77008 RepID=UPI00042373BF|nr:endonuclease/exonuclease/phosphatase family protein [Pseudorhodobacter ferrugineus]